MALRVVWEWKILMPIEGAFADFGKLDKCGKVREKSFLCNLFSLSVETEKKF